MKKLSYANGTSDIALRGETIGEALLRTVELYGDREALVVAEQGYRATYRELWNQTTALAKALMAAGVKKGDRVAIWAANRYEWVITQFATPRVGAVMVNINPGFKNEGVEFVLKQSEVSLLITAQRFKATDYIDILNTIRPHCPYPSNRTVILDRNWSKFLELGKNVSDEELAEREASLSFDDPINIQYTSGTTGLPKGATLTHHNIVNNGFFIGEGQRLTEQDRVCIPVPFYHCFGMVLGNLACITHGSCMVIPGEVFEPELVMKTAQEEKCTALYGVPTMFIAELAHPSFKNYDFSTLRTGIMAGSPCPVDSMEQVIAKMHMKEVTICYGMTETSPVSTQSKYNDPVDKRTATVGKVHPHVEIKIIDPKTGKIVPRGERGELCTRGYSVMLGYWNDSEGTDKVIDRNGWMHSGDVAVMDDEGYVAIVGRTKDIIIRGGENISPKEIEDFLIKHEGIQDVQVIGVPSEKYGEEVMAWVKRQPGFDYGEEELARYCKGRIATFKTPRYWKFVEEFPMTAAGKIRKVEMREIAAKELGLEGVKSIHTED
ncbi:MAG: AMP-binding protein [Prevotellaceae bacterium]|jgi:fatty-acyl-CoA synthase|nr:AMP-binding protein [Prevotellaceae bacterium]